MEHKLAQVEAIFTEALSRPTESDRAACLQQACGNDMRLRQQVEALLAAHDNAGSFLAITASQQPEPIREGVGAVIGRYKLLEQIGEGGFGVVFMAEQRQPVRRKVALKIIKLGMDTKQVIARFEAERQALAMMDHPNIAKVLDGGATETGRPYFVMDLVRGVPITEFCDQNKLTTRQRLELFLSVCSALQHAHQKGIIHRDLKPNNILVTMHDDRALPVVIDFGIAKATSARLTEQTLFTEFRQFIGTPQYMSPEQAQMSGLDVDTRSDIYSLGVLLYELLAGTTPFDPKQLRSAAYGEMQRIIREVDPPPPSTRLGTMAAGTQTTLADRRRCSPRDLSRSLKGDLDCIIMKCLEKDRSRRYESAGALSRDLQRYLSDEPVEATPPSAAYKFRKLLRKHRAEAIGVGAVMAALLLGIIGTTIGMAQARRNLAAVKQAEGRLKTEKELADAAAMQARQAQQKEAAERRQADVVAARLEAIFHHLDPNAEEKGGQNLRTQLVSELDSIAAELQKDTAQDPQVRARLLDSIGYTQLQMGEIAKAEKLLESAVAIIRSTGGPSDAHAYLAMAHLAAAWEAAGRYTQAVKLLESVLAWQENHLGPHHSDILTTMGSLGDTYEDLGRAADSRRIRDQIIARRSITSDSEDALKLKDDLAARNERAGRIDEAIKLREQLRDAQVARLGADHPVTLRTLCRLGEDYAQSGRGSEAVALLEGVRDRQIKVLGPDHFDVLYTLSALGSAYDTAGRHQDELAIFENLSQRCAQKLGPDHPWTLIMVNNLALAYQDVGRKDEALKLFQDLVDRRTRVLGRDHPQTLSAKYNLANQFNALGQTAEGIQLLEEIRGPQLEKLGPDHPSLLMTLGMLGQFYGTVGRSAEAVRLLEEVRERSVKNLGPDHPHTIITTSDLGCAYEMLQRHEDAIRMWTDVRERLQKKPQIDRVHLYPNLIYNLASEFKIVGRTDEAIKLFEQDRDERLARVGTNDPDSGMTLYQLGEAYRSQGRLKEARTAFLTARSGWLNMFKDNKDALTHLPLGAENYAQRGGLFAALGEFQEAADDFQHAIQLKPDEHRYWHEGLMPLLLQLGKRSEFNRRLGDELRRFSNTTDPNIAHRVAKDALVIPVDPEHLKIATELADRALAIGKEGWTLYQTKGMAEYRNGNYSQAIPWFIQTEAYADVGYSHTLADLFLAMCYQQTGDHRQAQESLERARDIMDNRFPQPSKGESVESFQDWIYCYVLRHEAEELIAGTAPTTYPATRPVAAR